jgi:hypothetical protein
MPVMRYFLYVGGVLLALLFVGNAFVPKSEVMRSASATTDAIDLPVIRIHSDRKWPERVVFDTSAPVPVIAATPAPAPAIEASVPAPSTAAAMSPKARVRETFAQFVSPEPKKPQQKPRSKNRIAKSRFAPMPVAQHQFLQHQRFAFSPNNFWGPSNIW